MEPEKKRPLPQDILASLEKEGRGRLTVFLGAAAGVGKTYAMLLAGQEALGEGLDVAIGWVETHGRRETEALLEGLPVLPPRELEYKGRAFKEMDIDGVLARKPKLALVDELAHTNIPGSRHKRRYHDVEELLEAGIDVYTTLNIQHLESLNDVVAQITEIPVRETVPDSLVESAAQVRLVDTPSEELLRRLEEGKVYVPEQAERAISKFFRPGNINALRELALRYTAEAVDRQLEVYRHAHAIEEAWAARELVLACVGPSPFSAQVIRTARRLAMALKAALLVAYVERPGASAERDEEDQLSKNLRLAEELGGEAIGLTGYDVAAELLALAHRRNVTQIVIGKPLRRGFRVLWQVSPVDAVIQGSAGMSVHVIPGEPRVAQRGGAAVRRRLRRIDARPYLSALVAVALLTLITRPLQPVFPLFFDTTNVAMLYLLPVLYAGIRWGTGPSALAAILSVLSFNFFFVPPQFTFAVANLGYLVTFTVFLAVALVTSQLSGRLRNQAETTRRREERISSLYRLSRELAAETELGRLLDALVRVVGQTLDADAVVFMPDAQGNLVSRPSPNLALRQDRARAVADWAFQHGEAAGKGTETLSGADALFVPLRAQEKTVGVLAVAARDEAGILLPEQRQIFEAFASMAAVAVLRLQLAEEARRAGHVAESEKLRTALFNSVSHDLRTPLASITGAVTSLQEEDLYDPAARRELIETIKEGAEWMDHFVGNLLDSARLEGGMLKLNKDWCDMQDIIGVALRRTSDALRDRPVRVEIPGELPLVRAEFTLIEQVVVNLLFNAIKYSPPDGEISVTVDSMDDALQVGVGDRGPGVAEEDRERIFDKFYRLYSPQLVSGTGLGLSICRGLVEAHGGTIWVEDNPGGGSAFKFTLLLEQQPTVREPSPKKEAEDVC